ncbi:MAG TPA: hypothetical protein DD420_15645 [Streptomyces sp.]|nr:hypothetical protein [Streptomyces sp.]
MYIDEIIRLLRPDLVVILIGLIVMLVTSIMGARMERLELWANHADILGMQSLGMLIVIIGLVLMLIHLYRLDAPAR